MVIHVARLILLVLGALPGIAAAQTLVIGRVTGAGRPLAHAEVGVEPAAVKTLTADSGGYRLLAPASGLVRIFARAVGFESASRRYMLAGGDTITVNFALTAVAQRLDSVAVTAPAAPPPGIMQGFEERRRVGFGHFYTRKQLSQREGSTTSNVLRTSGMQLILRPQQCGNGYSIATGRGSGFRWENWMSCGGRGKLPIACYAVLWLNGTLYWAPGAPGIGPPDIDELKVNDLEGIEVYRSGSEVPVQYQTSGSGCGVVLFWTRVGGSSG